jgi:hypothetical protein
MTFGHAVTSLACPTGPLKENFVANCHEVFIFPVAQCNSNSWASSNSTFGMRHQDIQIAQAAKAMATRNERAPTALSIKATNIAIVPRC